MELQCAFRDLCTELTCPLCDRLFINPHTFSGCGHTHCRDCVISKLEGPGVSKSQCPTCKQPVWKKDLKHNFAIQSLVEKVFAFNALLPHAASGTCTAGAVADREATSAVSQAVLGKFAPGASDEPSKKKPGCCSPGTGAAVTSPTLIVPVAPANGVLPAPVSCHEVTELSTTSQHTSEAPAEGQQQLTTCTVASNEQQHPTSDNEPAPATTNSQPSGFGDAAMAGGQQRHPVTSPASGINAGSCQLGSGTACRAWRDGRHPELEAQLQVGCTPWSTINDADDAQAIQGLQPAAFSGCLEDAVACTSHMSMGDDAVPAVVDASQASQLVSQRQLAQGNVHQPVGYCSQLGQQPAQPEVSATTHGDQPQQPITLSSILRIALSLPASSRTAWRQLLLPQLASLPVPSAQQHADIQARLDHIKRGILEIDALLEGLEGTTAHAARPGSHVVITPASEHRLMQEAGAGHAQVHPAARKVSGKGVGGSAIVPSPAVRDSLQHAPADPPRPCEDRYQAEAAPQPMACRPASAAAAARAAPNEIAETCCNGAACGTAEPCHAECALLPPSAIISDPPMHIGTDVTEEPANVAAARAADAGAARWPLSDAIPDLGAEVGTDVTDEPHYMAAAVKAPLPDHDACQARSGNCAAATAAAPESLASGLGDAHAEPPAVHVDSMQLLSPETHAEAAASSLHGGDTMAEGTAMELADIDARMAARGYMMQQTCTAGTAGDALGAAQPLPVLPAAFIWPAEHQPRAVPGCSIAQQLPPCETLDAQGPTREPAGSVAACVGGMPPAPAQPGISCAPVPNDSGSCRQGAGASRHVDDPKALPQKRRRLQLLRGPSDVAARASTTNAATVPKMDAMCMDAAARHSGRSLIPAGQMAATIAEQQGCDVSAAPASQTAADIAPQPQQASGMVVQAQVVHGATKAACRSALLHAARDGPAAAAKVAVTTAKRGDQKKPQASGMVAQKSSSSSIPARATAHCLLHPATAMVPRRPRSATRRVRRMLPANGSLPAPHAPHPPHQPASPKEPMALDVPQPGSDAAGQTDRDPDMLQPGAEAAGETSDHQAAKAEQDGSPNPRTHPSREPDAPCTIVADGVGTSPHVAPTRQSGDGDERSLAIRARQPLPLAARKRKGEQQEAPKAAHRNAAQKLEVLQVTPQPSGVTPRPLRLPKNPVTLARRLVGKRVQVWWADDHCYYAGTVVSFNQRSNRHQVLYDDGEEESLKLDREIWHLEDGGQQATHPTSSPKPAEVPEQDGEQDELIANQGSHAHATKKAKALATADPRCMPAMDDTYGRAVATNHESIHPCAGDLVLPLEPSRGDAALGAASLRPGKGKCQAPGDRPHRGRATANAAVAWPAAAPSQRKHHEAPFGCANIHRPFSITTGTAALQPTDIGSELQLVPRNPYDFDDTQTNTADVSRQQLSEPAAARKDSSRHSSKRTKKSGHCPEPVSTDQLRTDTTPILLPTCSTDPPPSTDQTIIKSSSGNHPTPDMARSGTAHQRQTPHDISVTPGAASHRPPAANLLRQHPSSSTTGAQQPAAKQNLAACDPADASKVSSTREPKSGPQACSAKRARSREGGSGQRKGPLRSGCTREGKQGSCSGKGDVEVHTDGPKSGGIREGKRDSCSKDGDFEAPTIAPKSGGSREGKRGGCGWAAGVRCMCIVASTMPADMRAKLQHFCRSMQSAELAADISMSTTHLVAAADENGLVVQRTRKYFCAILMGLPIVTLQWASESMAAGRWLDEQPFLVKGDTFCTGGPEAGRQRLLAGGALLFAGMKFHLGHTSKAQGADAAVRKLIELGGGQLVKRLPPDRHEASAVLVVVLGDCTPGEARLLTRRWGNPPVSNTYITDCVSAYRLLDKGPYQLTDKASQ